MRKNYFFTFLLSILTFGSYVLAQNPNELVNSDGSINHDKIVERLKCFGINKDLHSASTPSDNPYFKPTHKKDVAQVQIRTEEQEFYDNWEDNYQEFYTYFGDNRIKESKEIFWNFDNEIWDTGYRSVHQYFPVDSTFREIVTNSYFHLQNKAWEPDSRFAYKYYNLKNVLYDIYKYEYNEGVFEHTNLITYHYNPTGDSVTSIITAIKVAEDEYKNESSILFYPVKRPTVDSILYLTIRPVQKLERKDEYIFDANGNLKTHNTYTWDVHHLKWYIQSKVEYTVDADGNLIEGVFSGLDNGIWTVYDKTEYHYDKSKKYNEVVFSNTTMLVFERNIPVHKPTGYTYSFYYNGDWYPAYKAEFIYEEKGSDAVDQIVKDLPVVIYPNPVKDLLNIKSTESLTDGVITLYNIQGQVVLTTSLKGINNTVDVSTLSIGTYFYTIQSKEGTNRGKVSIQ